MWYFWTFVLFVQLVICSDRSNKRSFQRHLEDSPTLPHISDILNDNATNKVDDHTIRPPAKKQRTSASIDAMTSIIAPPVERAKKFEKNFKHLFIPSRKRGHKASSTTAPSNEMTGFVQGPVYKKFTLTTSSLKEHVPKSTNKKANSEHQTPQPVNKASIGYLLNPTEKDLPQFPPSVTHHEASTVAREKPLTIGPAKLRPNASGISTSNPLQPEQTKNQMATQTTSLIFHQYKPSIALNDDIPKTEYSGTITQPNHPNGNQQSIAMQMPDQGNVLSLNHKWLIFRDSLPPCCDCNYNFFRKSQSTIFELLEAFDKFNKLIPFNHFEVTINAFHHLLFQMGMIIRDAAIFLQQNKQAIASACTGMKGVIPDYWIEKLSSELPACFTPLDGLSSSERSCNAREMIVYLAACAHGINKRCTLEWAYAHSSRRSMNNLKPAIERIFETERAVRVWCASLENQ